jgi:predicted Zn finger-like uncharacterized protein
MSAESARNFKFFDNTNTDKSKSIAVVQCPACQTKFAVNSNVIEKLASPRFHCSRCDNVFSLEPTFSPEPFTDSFEANTTPEEPSNSNFNSNINEDSVSNFSYSPKSTQLDFFENSTHSSAFGIDESGEEFSVDVAQIGDQLFDIGITDTIKEEPMGYGSLSRVEVADRIVDPLQNKPVVKTPPSYKILFAPAFASIILFGSIAILSMISPNTISTITSSFIASKENSLPSDLFVSKASLKRIVTDSGETISVISGKIKNASNSTISDLYLEGAIFDSSGKILEKRKAHYNSALNKSRIQSLSLTMIDELQSAKPARNTPIKPQQESEFTIVIPEPQSISSLPPSSYITRVYSGKVKV